jgi:hypothetical protein
MIASVVLFGDNVTLFWAIHCVHGFEQYVYCATLTVSIPHCLSFNKCVNGHCMQKSFGLVFAESAN